MICYITITLPYVRIAPLQLTEQQWKSSVKGRGKETVLLRVHRFLTISIWAAVPVMTSRGSSSELMVYSIRLETTVVLIWRSSEIRRFNTGRNNKITDITAGISAKMAVNDVQRWRSSTWEVGKRAQCIMGMPRQHCSVSQGGFSPTVGFSKRLIAEADVCLLVPVCSLYKTSINESKTLQLL